MGGQGIEFVQIFWSKRQCGIPTRRKQPITKEGCKLEGVEDINSKLLNSRLKAQFGVGVIQAMWRGVAVKRIEQCGRSQSDLSLGVGRHRQKASQRSNHWEMGHFIRGEAMLQQMKLVHLNITGHSASSTYADQASKVCNVLKKVLARCVAPSMGKMKRICQTWTGLAKHWFMVRRLVCRRHPRGTLVGRVFPNYIEGCVMPKTRGQSRTKSTLRSHATGLDVSVFWMFPNIGSLPADTWTLTRFHFQLW